MTLYFLAFISIIFFGVGCTAYFAGTETGLVGLDRVTLRGKVESGQPHAKALHAIVSHPERFLATSLVGNNLSLVVATSFATSLGYHLSSTHQWDPIWVDSIIGAVLGFILLFFGEILPKIIFSQKPLKYCLKVTPLLTLMDKLLSPASRAVNLLTHYLKSEPRGMGKPALSRDELKIMFKYAPEVVSAKDQGALIENIFELKDLRCSDILVPRVDLIGIPHNATYQEVLEYIEEYEFTRLPVYEDNLDKIIGILDIKDLIRNYQSEDWQTLTKKPYFIPENKKVLELLAEMKDTSEHFAVVFDEYGGTEGIITMEDILEEIVGEIDDEFDDKRGIGRKLPDGSFLVKGNAEIDDVNETFNLEISKENGYSTINGWILHFLGKIPLSQEKVLIDPYQILIVKADPRKILEIKIKEKGDI